MYTVCWRTPLYFLCMMCKYIYFSLLFVHIPMSFHIYIYIDVHIFNICLHPPEPNANAPYLYTGDFPVVAVVVPDIKFIVEFWVWRMKKQYPDSENLELCLEGPHVFTHHGSRKNSSTQHDSERFLVINNVGVAWNGSNRSQQKTGRITSSNFGIYNSYHFTRNS